MDKAPKPQDPKSQDPKSQDPKSQDPKYLDPKHLQTRPLQPKSLPPESWTPIHRAFSLVASPVRRFLHIEAASGLLLLVMSVISIALANSPWSVEFANIWHTHIGINIGANHFEQSLHFLVNEGLMTLFFFVVGLEIRREMAEGELSEWKRALLPLVCALGGMLVPALVYKALNPSGLSAGGWGIPMATDIAFAVGVLSLLGKRVPPALRILLLALAVIDDVGAILVIAFFYSSQISIDGFGILIVGLLASLLMKRAGLRAPLLYVFPGLVVWFGAYRAGVHPTLAGVAMGLLTPVKAWEGDASRTRQTEDIVSPAERLIQRLHIPVAFGIMPLFALANAGVSFQGLNLSGGERSAALGVLLGLCVGKPMGVLGFAWVARRLGLVTIPKGIRFPHIALVGFAAGIGFTMSIFVTELAFESASHPTFNSTSKIAVVLASAVSAIFALVYGSWILRKSEQNPALEGGALSLEEAESSTEH